MQYAEWKNYWRSLDWSRKWFPIFILIRPVADNFYYLKQVSPFISPLYILGVLTPILILFSFKSVALRGKTISSVDAFMRIWGTVIFFNCAIFLLYQFSLENFGSVIKYITPPLLFFYARSFVRSKEDLVFILTTFLYSCIFPLGMLAFETLVHPITLETVSEGRGGGYRIHGSYSDCMNYAVYIVGAMIVYGYFFLDRVYTYRVRKIKPPVFKMMMVFLICLGGIISIRHVSSWAVFLAIALLFFFFNAKNLKGLGVAVFFVLVVSPFFARSIYEKQLEPLLQKEISVMNGDSEIEYSFNGRMSRWQRYFEVWDQMPVYAHFFGVSATDFSEVPVMIGGGMHSDYVRMLFLTGMFGLLVYLVFIIAIIGRRKNFRTPEKFLILASVSSLMLYSVSTLPLIYFGYIQLMFPVFAFALLPKAAIYQSRNSPQPEASSLSYAR